MKHVYQKEPFIAKPNRRSTKDFTPINGQIRCDEVRVILEDGGTLGVMPTRQAVTEAQNQGVDLVLVSPNAKPPVTKIIDFGKYKYQQEKKKKDNKKASKQKDMKEIRFGLKIDVNDLNIKMKKAREFLIDGHKVKLSATYKGREMAHREIGYQVLANAAEKFEGLAIEEQKPTMAGRRLSATYRPDTKAIADYLKSTGVS